LTITENQMILLNWPFQIPRADPRASWFAIGHWLRADGQA